MPARTKRVRSALPPPRIVVRALPTSLLPRPVQLAVCKPTFEEQNGYDELAESTRRVFVRFARAFRQSMVQQADAKCDKGHCGSLYCSRRLSFAVDGLDLVWSTCGVDGCTTSMCARHDEHCCDACNKLVCCNFECMQPLEDGDGEFSCHACERNFCSPDCAGDFAEGNYNGDQVCGACADRYT
jgi:hypothetical protein